MSQQSSSYESFKSFRWLGFLLILVSFYSCYTRKLDTGQYLLDKNHIEVDSKELDEDELSNVIKQRPNKKILGILKFHLFLHNIPDSAKVERKKKKKLERKNKKIARKNKKRLRRGKDTLSYKNISDVTTFGEKLLYTIGEPPVILDTAEVHRTAKQLNVFLIKKGFFNNAVSDSIHYIRKGFFKKKRAEVYYRVKAKDPYRIKSFKYESKDIDLIKELIPYFEDKLVREGDIFDVSVLDKERDRITTVLLDNGYYRFNKNYIKYLIDSTVGGRNVEIVLNINLAKEKLPKGDSVITKKHEKYYISSVYLNYLQDETSPQVLNYSFKGINYRIQGKNDIRLRLFHKAMHLKPGDLFQNKKKTQMYRDFTSFSLFRTIDIKIEPDSTGDYNLKLTVTLRENKKQELRVDGNLTNTGGSNFGVESSTFYNHKNIFRGAEVFKLGFNGALEYQPLVIEDDNSPDNSNAPINVQSFSNISSAFNTIEFGPEMSLTFPKLLFFNTSRYTFISNARTKIAASLNYQRRINVNVLDYERGIQELIYSYTWNVKKKVSHLLEPIAISAIEVNKSQEFTDRINNINDKLLAASFQSNIISATRYRFVYNELLDKKKNKKTSFYYSGSAEAAGNLLRAGYDLLKQNNDTVIESYDLFGVQFAQYVKTAHDIRMYNELNDKNSFVFRLNGGIGVPLKNSRDALPFVKSFFAGGTDKLRAWKARSLGPGSFRDSTLVFDKIGEILLESNVEYRFDLLGFLDGALFVDAGNIWLMQEDSLRPGSQFKVNSFLSEIAIGAGVGIRIDLDFFLLRFDLGFPVKNPTLIKGERWFFQPKDEYESYLQTLSNPERAPSLYSPQFNIGIGFPF